LRGKILEALDNRPFAAEAFREALRIDAYCFEAFRALTSHEILTAEEEKELVATMPVDVQSDSSGKEQRPILNFTLRCKL
jgi:anaphase-promoting complex subunit 6